jgi:hypothetical protein
MLAEHYENPRRAAAAFERACTLQFAAACDNAKALGAGGVLRHDAPTLADYRIILRGSKGPLKDQEPAHLLERACAIGWPSACGRS